MANDQKAFPAPYWDVDQMRYLNQGLTKRELFAAMALQGFCANPAVFATNPMSGWNLVNCDEEQLAKYCNKMADALLSALDVPKGNKNV
jgi:hypothetical protein